MDLATIILHGYFIIIHSFAIYGFWCAMYKSPKSKMNTKKNNTGKCIQTGKPCGFPCFDGCSEHKKLIKLND